MFRRELGDDTNERDAIARAEKLDRDPNLGDDRDMADGDNQENRPAINALSSQAEINAFVDGIANRLPDDPDAIRRREEAYMKASEPTSAQPGSSNPWHLDEGDDVDLPPWLKRNKSQDPAPVEAPSAPPPIAEHLLTQEQIEELIRSLGPYDDEEDGETDLTNVPRENLEAADATINSYFTETEKPWKSIIAAKRDAIIDGLSQAEKALVEELRGKVSPEEEGQKINELTHSENPFTSEHAVFKPTHIAEDALEHIRAKRPELESLNRWDNYLDNQAEIDRKLHGLERDLVGLNGEISGTRAAGGDVSSLERNRDDLLRELSEVRSQVPEEMRDEARSVESNNELVNIARARQPESFDGEEEPIDREVEDAAKNRLHDLGLATDPEIRPGDASELLGADGKPLKRELPPVDPEEVRRRQEGIDEILARAREVQPENHLEDSPIAGASGDTEEDHTEEGSNPLSTSEVTPAPVITPVPVETPPPAHNWWAPEDNEDDDQDRGFGGPRPSTTEPPAVPFTPPPPPERRREVPDETVFPPGENPYQITTDRYIEAQIKARSMRRGFMGDLFRRVRGQESSLDIMERERQAYVTQRNRYIQTQAIERVHRRYPVIDESFEGQEAYREALSEEVARLFLQETRYFEDAQFAAIDRSFFRRVASRLYRNPPLRAAVGLGINIGTAFAVSTGIVEPHIGMTAGRFVAGAIGIEGGLHTAGDAFQGNNRVVGDRVRQNVQEANTLDNDQVDLRRASFIEDNYLKHQEVVDRTLDRLNITKGAGIATRVRDMVELQRVDGESAHLVERVIREVLEAERSTQRNDLELRIARQWRAGRWVTALIGSAFLTGFTGRAPEAAPQPNYMKFRLEQPDQYYRQLIGNGEVSSLWGQSQAFMAREYFGIEGFNPNNVDHQQQFLQRFNEDPGTYSQALTHFVDAIRAIPANKEAINGDFITHHRDISLGVTADSSIRDYFERAVQAIRTRGQV